MARTIKSIEYKVNKEELITNINSILSSNEFKPFNYNGESVYKKGVGFWTAAKYIKIEFIENKVNISGWVKNFGVSESNLEGFVGVIPKSTVTKVINDIIEIIK